MDVLPSLKQMLLPGLGVLVMFVVAAIWGERLGLSGTLNPVVVYVIGFVSGLLVLFVYMFLKGYRDVDSISER